MATDLFGIRVLDVDLERREVELRVFVVYYDTDARTHAVLPARDPGFFLGTIWSQGRYDHPIGEAVSVDQVLDRNWMVRNARWFVENVERTATLNNPPSDETWAQLHDFYYERFGGWADEDILIQAEYTIRVTDSAWIEHLKPGQNWADAFYAMEADCPSFEDLPRVPNMHDKTVLRPFGSKMPNALVFSDDGRFLAVQGYDDKVVVYACDDWSEHCVFEVSEASLGRIAWLPGEHVIVVTTIYRNEQSAYDVDTRTHVDIPLQAWESRSRSGSHRATHGDYELAVFVEGREPVPVPALAEREINSVAFTSDGSRLYTLEWDPEVFVVDTATGAVVETLADGPHMLSRVALSPDDAYLALVRQAHESVWDPAGNEFCVRRLGDNAEILSYRPGCYIADIDWSPDNRWLALGLERDDATGGVEVFPIGLPSEPPPGLAPRGDEPRVEIDHG